MHWVYFPTGSVVSLIYTMENGDTAEMGLVGNEGVVGVALVLGGETTPNQAVAQVAGGALRMKAQFLCDEFQRGGPFQVALLRYTQALITQISQTAVCNRLHPVEKRLCRWLLMTRNRLLSDQILMTQEFIAYMLGVRREGVTAAAHHLQEVGLIRYHRGHITIVDRHGLEFGRLRVLSRGQGRVRPSARAMGAQLRLEAVDRLRSRPVRGGGWRGSLPRARQNIQAADAALILLEHCHAHIAKDRPSPRPDPLRRPRFRALSATLVRPLDGLQRRHAGAARWSASRIPRAASTTATAICPS